MLSGHPSLVKGETDSKNKYSLCAGEYLSLAVGGDCMSALPSPCFPFVVVETCVSDR